jgi:hypothetical protein
MYKLLAIFALPLLLAGLSGCGGGGGGGSAPPATSPTTQFPLAGAISAFSQAAHNYTVSATNASDTYTLQINYTPGVATTFEGQSASTMALAGTFSKNGAVLTTVSQTSYFVTSPYKPLGSLDLGNGHYTVAANQQNLPANTTVGTSGQFDTDTTYTNNTKTVVYSNATQTWSLAADTATTAWACVNAIETVVGSTPISSADCYKIDTTGNVLAYKANVTFSGTTLSFN